MKKLLTRSLIIVCLLLILASCKKDSSPGSPAPATFTPYLKGKIDGRAFNVTANSLYAIGTTAGSELTMGGHFESDGSISIHLKNFNNSTGVRQINENNYIAIDTCCFLLYYAGSIISGTPIQGNGKITILSVTEMEVKGTFEGVLLVDQSQNIARSPLNVAEGEFHLTRKQ